MKKYILFLLLLLSANLNAQNEAKGVNKVILDNGLTVLIKEIHTQPVVSVQVWVKVGSVYEKETQRGLTHFLEHLIFKGTKNYPGDEISRKVEAEGGIINAATSKEFTHYHIDIQKEGALEAIKILADAMANITLPQDEMDKERPVVIEEIVRHFDNPGGVIYDNFSEALFPKSPYRESIIGSSTVVKNVSRDEILGYYNTWYVPSNMFLSVVGDIDTAKAMAVIKNTFGKHQNRITPPPPDLSEPFHGPDEIIQKKEVEHCYLLGGFLGPDVKSDDQFAADITSTILGGGRSSRLFRVLREEKQLVYAINSSFESQRGPGMMYISSVFNPENKKKVMDEIIKQINILMKDGPTDAELIRAKEMTKSDWYFDKESYHEQGAAMGYWYMQGNPEMVDKYIENIEKVTKKEVVNFLRKYYEPQSLSYAMLVPEKGK